MTERGRVQLGFALPLLGTDESDHDDNVTDPDILGHRNPRWSDWDGGKVGGVPSWLNPRDLPRESPLRCRGPCGDAFVEGNVGEEKVRGGTAMRFVAQLYCPADDDASNDAAYHRSLYVFACPTCCREAASSSSSSSSSPSHSSEATASTSTDRRRLLSNCVRVLRCQLPKHNDFYPPSCDDLDDDVTWTRHTSRYWSDVTGDDTLNLCAVSGQRSRVGKCPTPDSWFCCPEHLGEQRSWGLDDEGHRRCDRRSRSIHVYRESELVVEEEPHPTYDGDAAPVLGGDDVQSSAAIAKFGSALFPMLDDAASDIDDPDADLTQIDLNAMTGNMSLTGVTDPITLAFYQRMNVGGDENDVRGQCLRYNRWPRGVGAREEGRVEVADDDDDDDAGGDDDDGPLWLSSNDRPPVGGLDETPFPPPCEYCGSNRDFEFQILPQMLSCLSTSTPMGSDDVPSSSGRSKTTTTTTTTTTESDFAILMEAHSMIESGMDLPAGFRETHEKSIANARNRLLCGNGGEIDGLGGSSLGVDWGVIAVYTCTASCGDGGIVSEENGCYREEVAWVQPPLD